MDTGRKLPVIDIRYLLIVHDTIQTCSVPLNESMANGRLAFI